MNWASQDILAKADYVEWVSQHTYKSKVFAYQIFKTGAPVIEKLPVVMKCQVEYISEAKGFICMIVVT